jgi:hypothetical protein
MGSVAAGLFGWLGGRRNGEGAAPLHKLQDLLAASRAAPDAQTLDELERDADAMFDSVYARGIKDELSASRSRASIWPCRTAPLRSRRGGGAARLISAGIVARFAWRDAMTDLPTRRSCSPRRARREPSSRSMRAGAAPLNPTPECHDGDAATLRQTEGRSSSRPRPSAPS